MQETKDELPFDSIQDREAQLADVVANQISQMIIERHLSAGERLPNEFRLAESLNVGRGTVREAVKLLVARNILVIQRGRGTFVAKNPGLLDDPLGFAFMPDKFKLIIDLLEVRMTLEPWVAELAAQRAEEEDVALIAEWCGVVEQNMLMGLPHMDADVQFHTSIAKATHNLVMPNLIPVIHSSINLLVEVTKSTLVRETIETHRRLAEAVAAHDPLSAKVAMMQHLVYNRDRVIQMCAKQELTCDKAAGQPDK